MGLQSPEITVECTQGGGSTRNHHLSRVFSQYGFVPSAPSENKQCVKPSTSSGNRHLFSPPLFFFRCCRAFRPHFLPLPHSLLAG